MKSFEELAREVREKFGEELTPKQVEERLAEVVAHIRAQLKSEGYDPPEGIEEFGAWLKSLGL